MELTGGCDGEAANSTGITGVSRGAQTSDTIWKNDLLSNLWNFRSPEKKNFA